MVAIPESLASLVSASLAGAGADLHHSTAPEAIRRAQRAEVAAHLALHPLATAAEVGHALDLPEFSVLMRLAELAGDPVPYRAFVRRFADNVNTPFFGKHAEKKT